MNYEEDEEINFKKLIENTKKDKEKDKDHIDFSEIKGKSVKANLININKGFILEKTLNTGKNLYPFNKVLNKTKMNGKKAMEFYHFLNRFEIDYLWIVQKMFPDHFIIDCQTKNGKEKGHPDFIVVHQDIRNLDEDIKFVEFKSKNDALSSEQIKWLYTNKSLNRYLIQLEEF